MSFKDLNISLNNYFLTFTNSELEQEFRKESIEKVKNTIRIAVSIGLTVFVLVSVFNVVKEDLPTYWINSLLIPTSGLAFLFLTYSKYYHKIYLFAVGAIYVLGGVSAIYSALYDPKFIMFLHLRIVFFTLIPFITLRLLVFSNVMLIITTVVMSSFFLNEGFDEIVKRGMFLIPFLVVSVVAFYIKQRFERLSFVKTRALANQNALLQIDKDRLENQGVLSVILQDSTDINMNLNDFLENALDVILYLPWLNVLSKGSIFVTNKAGFLEMKVSKNLGQLNEICKLVKPGQCLCGKALAQKKLLFNNCVTADHDTQPEGIQPHGHYNVPLMLGEECLGVLNIYVKHGHEKTDEEEEFLLLVADTLASVIYRDKLQKEKQQQANELSLSHQKIKASIDYAQRIQSSLMKSDVILSKLFSDTFVSYLPKEVVSGDFYLVKQKENLTYVAVADCTGHGVPGAIVSTLGIQELSHIIDENNFNVAQILDVLNYKVSALLNNDNEIGSDGMDLILICVDSNKKTIEYAGAKGLFYMLNNNEITTLKTDRVSIGQKIKNNDFAFELKQISFTENDTVLLLTDGLIDQLSINNKKRIGSKRVKEMFAQMAQLQPNEKEAFYNKFLKTHISDNQTDDITVIAFKL